MRQVLLIAVLGACSIPDKHLTGGGDARAQQDVLVTGDGAGAFGCIGHEIPTSAPPTIKLSGGVFDVVTGQAAPGVPLQFLRTDTGAEYLQLTSGTTGFSGQAQTGAMPIPTVVDVSGPGIQYLPSQFIPSRPFDADDTTMQIAVATPGDLTQLYSLIGMNYNAQDATMLVFIVDCMGLPLEGASLSAPGVGGTVMYFNGQLPDPNATKTDASGRVLMLNVPPINATFTATDAGGHPFLQYLVAVPGSSTVQLTIQP